MTTKYFASLLLLFPFALFAQQNSGMVIYEETMKLEIDLPEGSQYAHLLPTEQKANYVLRFTADESHYASKPKTEEPAPINLEEGGAQIQIKVMNGGENAVFYTDLENKKSTELRDVFGRPFRIENELEEVVWKMTNEQKEILGFTCIQAIAGPDSLQTIAWFTPQVPVSAGPASFGQLPGLILEVTEGSLTIVATDILSEIDDVSLIEAPRKGKKITEEEYEALMEEKMQEMQQSMPSGGHRIEIRG